MAKTTPKIVGQGQGTAFDERQNFFEERAVDIDRVSPLILASWQRSKLAGVNPDVITDYVLSQKEQEEQRNFIRKYGDQMIVIRKTALEMGLNFQIFDARGLSFRKYNFSDYLAEEELAFNRVQNLSEGLVGTNAASLALRENKPVQMRGCDHYCSYFDDYYCSAAPIHDANGNVIGAINTFRWKRLQGPETLGLMELLATLFDNLLLITNAAKEKSFYDITINEITEHLPDGLIFLDEDGFIKHYNRQILNFFKLKESPDVNKELSGYLSKINGLKEKREFEKKEILLDIQGTTRSFLLSVRQMMDLNQKSKGRIIIIEDTHSLLKSAQILRGNMATYSFRDIIGNHPKLMEAKTLGEKVAKAPSSVLIFGESGTGKELFAQAIHNASPRNRKPFVAVNCGAVPTDLIESELFGYEAGAFTGALKGGKPGKIELADGGTLFLDEIESMPLNMQIKLLRMLSSGSISKIGGHEEIPVNVRIISATKKDLLREADSGTFREDLYYRINTFVIKLPPLRERKEDIALLARFFIDKLTAQFGLNQIEIGNDYLEALVHYHWRGNVRELQNEIERSVVLLGQESILTKNHLHERVTRAGIEEDIRQSIKNIGDYEFGSKNGLLKLAEEILIEKILLEEDGNITRSAKRLGITTPTLYQKIGASPRLKEIKKIYSGKLK